MLAFAGEACSPHLCGFGPRGLRSSCCIRGGRVADAPARRYVPAMDASGRATGWSFEDFEVGKSVGSATRSVSEADIRAFAELSGDRNPVHVDPAFAQRTAFRGCIAHGMLVQSIASGLMWQTGVFVGTVVAVQEARASFVGPVRPGDEVHMDMAVLEREPEPGPRRGWVKVGVTVRNQRGEAVVESDWKIVVTRRRAK